MSDWYANPTVSTCLHLHITIESTGSLRFIAGEVVDDIRERLYCLDCCEYLSEGEVRAAWNGEAQFCFTPEQEIPW